MNIQDNCVTIGPYFKVKEGKMAGFKQLCERFTELSKTEKGCLYYGFGFEGDIAFCREGYTDAIALLTHLEHVGPLIEEGLKISELVRVELHGTESELAKLRGPLAALKPQFFVMEYGFRK